MTSDGPPAGIEVSDLSFAYARPQVLRSVSLSLARGSATAIIGPNGSGKTTLMSCINGLLRPQNGAVHLLGRPVRELKTREVARLVASVPQEFQVPFAYRVREIVSLGRSPYLSFLGSLTESDHRVVDESLQSTGLTDLQSRTYNELSGGEKQRVAVALALAQEPAILLLDEPTTHLDLAHQIEVMSLVRKVAAERGMTVLASMHDINLAAAFFPRMIVLDAGRVVADGPPSIVISRELLRKVFAVDAQVIVNGGSRPIQVVPRIASPPEN